MSDEAAAEHSDVLAAATLAAAVLTCTDDKEKKGQDITREAIRLYRIMLRNIKRVHATEAMPIESGSGKGPRKSKPFAVLEGDRPDIGTQE